MIFRNSLAASRVMLLVLLSVVPLAADAGAVNGAVRKEIMKRALLWDLRRDAATKAIPLAAERNVFRYTTRTQAERELKAGIAAGKHLTATARAGRPPLAKTAQRQYGLPKPPEVRLTIRLQRGTPVKPNKALAGSPGRGELTLPKKLGAETIQKVVPLR